MADRNLVRVLENTRLSPGRNTLDAQRTGRQVIVIVDAGDSLGITFGRDCEPDNAAQNKETRQTGEKHFPTRVRDIKKLLLPNINKL